MFCAKYLICFWLFNVFHVLTAEPAVPVFYAQDYCHYSTINHQIHVNEDRQTIIIRANRGPYRPDLDCQLRIVNSGLNGTGIHVLISAIDLRKNIDSKDYLVIKFDDQKSRLQFKQRFITNQNQKEKFFLTSRADDSNEVVIRFTSPTENHGLNDDKGFEIIITLFKPKTTNNTEDPDSDGVCEKRFSFDCGNDLCIHKRLVCNGVDNCGNNWDEPENCKHSRNNNWFDFFDSGFWFGFKIVMILLLIGVLLGIMSCICKTYDENKKLRKQLLLEDLKRHSGYRMRNNSIFSLNQSKTPLYPQLYRTYGGTEA